MCEPASRVSHSASHASHGSHVKKKNIIKRKLLWPFFASVFLRLVWEVNSHPFSLDCRMVPDCEHLCDFRYKSLAFPVLLPRNLFIVPYKLGMTLIIDRDVPMSEKLRKRFVFKVVF